MRVDGRDGVDGRRPLEGERVVDLTVGIAGGYATKLLADAGADVVKVEDPEGDPLRGSADAAAGDAPPLFRFLGAGKSSVVAEDADAADVTAVLDLVRASDGVVWTPGSAIADHPALQPSALRSAAPGATVVALTPFGLGAPVDPRLVTEATLQAMAGSAGQRGDVSTPPLVVGGGLGDWIAGLTTGLSYLIARHRRVRGDTGELVDVSALEAQCLTMSMYPVTYASIAGAPMRRVRVSNVPGVHPARDGYVGFMVVTGQQWLDFAALVGRPDWADDADLLRFHERSLRRAELVDAIERWTAARTCKEIAELAVAMRIPVAVLGNGRALVEEADLLDRERWLVPGADGDFLQPAPPYRLPGTARLRPPSPAPGLGARCAHAGAVRRLTRRRAEPAVTAAPFEGLRVVEFGNNWAGPLVGHVLAMFGADVIRVESIQHVDPLRYNTVRSMDDDRFWEWSPLQHGPNTSKRAITLNMSSPDGRELARRLIGRSDVLVENSSPRVMDAWGLDAEGVAAIDPRIVYVRMPAYGLAGPWRDRVGYAQTIEMAAGLAWVTGTPSRSPEIPNSPCDPIAGLHAVVATLLALEHRRVTGEGGLVEVPMIGAALNVAAEQVLDWTHARRLDERLGNRSAHSAPQGAYRTADDDLPFGQGRWVLISVVDDHAWDGLRRALGEPTWALDPALGTVDGRHADHDRIDNELSAWCAGRRAADVVETLASHGVAAAVVRLPHEQVGLQELTRRGFFSAVEHPVTGAHLHGGFPAQFSAGPPPDRLHRRAAPTLGEHNVEVLRDVLGLDEAAIARLAAADVIGWRPVEAASVW